MASLNHVNSHKVLSGNALSRNGFSGLALSGRLFAKAPKNHFPTLRAKIHPFSVRALTKEIADIEFMTFKFDFPAVLPTYNPDLEIHGAHVKPGWQLEEASMLHEHLGWDNDAFVAPVYYKGKFWRCSDYTFVRDYDFAMAVQLREIDVDNYVNLIFSKIKDAKLIGIFSRPDLIAARKARYDALSK